MAISVAISTNDGYPYIVDTFNNVVAEMLESGELVLKEDPFLIHHFLEMKKTSQKVYEVQGIDYFIELADNQFYLAKMLDN